MTVSAVLAWLHGQVTALASTIGAVTANRPEPARQVAVYLLVFAALAWAAPKIIKKLK